MNREGTRKSGSVDNSNGKQNIPWSQRLHHFTWSSFEVTMSTGALATLIGQQTYKIPGNDAIGWFFAILNVILFITFTGCIIYRFTSVRGSLTKSLHHPHESFFFGAYFVSLALILYCADLYVAIETLYWTFAVIVALVAVLQFHFIFDSVKLPVTNALPAWILPVYPFLMLGVVGSAILKNQPATAGLPIFIGSIAFQGLGWTVAYFFLTIYVTRLVNSDLPAPPKRPAMFVAVGPAAYTVNTFVALGMQAPKHIPKGFLGIDSIPVGDVFKAVAILVGVFMWLVSFWFSALSTVSVLISANKSHFTLNWWAFIFPNVGLVTALLQIAEALELNSVQVVCAVATGVLTLLWIFCAVMHVRALLRREILWPGQDEDMEDINGDTDDMDGDEGGDS
ncbi:C4-dicarboxylate transporter/malic acid transport protein-like protein [Boeremia exigua]|uniref:C4-dicarboxylate transporter/malic acid transport protein-like protein n=1 Tax=Boeremia exigua TaxID=749465 RepID=UPI001E8E6EBD|nr:C4-dicarboxylate transporter/malic acid transport protein-like protein [Boeremia exigua]KAH6644320.1 C4-dicarboxylate transporter/malic acid transport protein-like protein [Boeremia exigua]